MTSLLREADSLANLRLPTLERKPFAIRSVARLFAKSVTFLLRFFFHRQAQFNLKVMEALKKVESSIDKHSSCLGLYSSWHAYRDHKDKLYALFEEKFRGPREVIVERQGVYLESILPAVSKLAAPVLDLGCGRGEWLELLKCEGIQALGVDTNTTFLRQCRHRGLRVIEGNALDYLRGLPDGSFSAVTAFHLIEHMHHSSMLDLFAETFRVLKVGGCAIFETPNPENLLVASWTFHLDPSHHKPLPSLLVKFFLQQIGFEDVEIQYLHPRPESFHSNDHDLVNQLNKYFFGPQDYGVVGWKR